LRDQFVAEEREAEGEGREQERTEKKGTEGMRENTLEINFWLRRCTNHTTGEEV